MSKNKWWLCLISLMCVLFSGKVFSKLNYTVPKSTIKEVAECKPRVIEVVLANLRMKVSRFMNFFDQASWYDELCSFLNFEIGCVYWPNAQHCNFLSYQGLCRLNYNLGNLTLYLPFQSQKWMWHTSSNKETQRMYIHTNFIISCPCSFTPFLQVEING